jgi:hypothetical protein
VFGIFIDLVQEKVFVEGLLEFLKCKVLGLMQVEIPTDFLESGLNLIFEVDLFKFGSLEVLNHVNILEIVAYLLDHKVTLYVFYTVLLQPIIEQPFNFLVVFGFVLIELRVLINHDYRAELTELVLLLPEKCQNHPLQILVFDVGDIHLKLDVPLILEFLKQLM